MRRFKRGDTLNINMGAKQTEPLDIGLMSMSELVALKQMADRARRRLARCGKDFRVDVLGDGTGVFVNVRGKPVHVELWSLKVAIAVRLKTKKPWIGWAPAVSVERADLRMAIKLQMARDN